MIRRMECYNASILYSLEYIQPARMAILVSNAVQRFGGNIMYHFDRSRVR